MAQPLREVSSLLLTLVFILAPLMAQASDAVRSRVHELHSKGSEVQVSLADGTSVRGQIIRIEPDSFLLRQKSAKEAVVPFAKVADVREQGGRLRKTLWVPLVIGVGALLALCVAPYPIGFLCRSDPS
jgi:hypothetical protein